MLTEKNNMRKITLLVLNAVAIIGALLSVPTLLMFPFAVATSDSQLQFLINIVIGIFELSVIFVYMYSIYLSQKMFRKGQIRMAFVVAIGAIIYQIIPVGIALLLFQLFGL